MSASRKRGPMPTHPAQPAVTSDLARVLVFAAKTPMTPGLRHAALVALWTAVAHLVPSERFKDLQSLIGALEAGYRHYGREQFAAGLRHARRDARAPFNTPPHTTTPTVH